MKLLLLPVVWLTILSILSACGTLPVPEVHWSVTEAGDSTPTQLSSVAVDKHQADRPITTLNITSEASIVSPDLPQLKSARAYWRYAVERLQLGDVAGGRLALDRALEISPRNRVAHKLLRQMEIDPRLEWGEQYFLHRIAPGESLSVLANDYLNDSLQFYLLARYNNIERPNTVSIGQLIRIPGAAPTTPVGKPIGQHSLVLDQARSAYDEENYELTIQLLEPVIHGKNSNQLTGLSNADVHGVLANAYAGLGQNALEEGDLKFAISMYLSASETETANLNARKLHETIEENIDIEASYRQAIQLGETDPVAARDLLRQVVLVKPDYRDAGEQLKILDVRVKRWLYREALRMQRGQKLDEAIALWDSLLQMDSNNENARLYRARAVELKGNLQKFVSGE